MQRIIYTKDCISITSSALQLVSLPENFLFKAQVQYRITEKFGVC